MIVNNSYWCTNGICSNITIGIERAIVEYADTDELYGTKLNDKNEHRRNISN